MRLQTLSDTLNRDRDRRAMLQNELTALTDASDVAPGDRVGAVSTLPPGPAAQKLQAAIESLREMETRLTPEHPDVVRQKRAVRDLQEKAEAEARTRPVTPVPSLPERRDVRAVRPDRA